MQKKEAVILVVAIILAVLLINFLLPKEKEVFVSENFSVITHKNIAVGYEKTEESVKVNFTRNSERIAEVELLEPEKKKITAKLAEADSPVISTDVFAIREPLKVKEATITLSKKGIVQAVFYCPEYDFDAGRCENWEATDIPFTQAGKTITFTVNHFTAYAGGGLNSSALVIWDETDEGMPFAGNARQPGNNTFFFANFTNTTSGSAITDSSANVSINFSDAVSDNMTYNSTSGLWQYNRTFGTEGTYFFTVNATSPFFDNLTATDSVLIANCTIPTDDFYVNGSIRFCLGTFQINDTGADGIIIINASNITVDFTNATIRGNNSGYGLYVFNVSNVTINDFKFVNYSNALYVTNSNNIIINNAVANNSFQIGSSNNVSINKIITQSFTISPSNNTNITGLQSSFAGTISASNNTSIYNSGLSTLDVTSSSNTLLQNTTLGSSFGSLVVSSSNSFQIINSSVQTSQEIARLSVSRDLRIINTNITANTRVEFVNVDGLEVFGSNLLKMTGIGGIGFSINNSIINNSVIDGITLNNATNASFFNNTLGGEITEITMEGDMGNSQFYNNNISGVFNVTGNYFDTAFANNLFSHSLVSSSVGSNITILNNTFYSGNNTFKLFMHLNSSIIANNSFSEKGVQLFINDSEFSGNIVSSLETGYISPGIFLNGSNNIIKNNIVSNSGLSSGKAGFELFLLNSTVYNLSSYNNTNGILLRSNITIENSTFANNSEYDIRLETGPFANFKNVVSGNKVSITGFLNATNFRMVNNNASVAYSYFNSSSTDTNNADFSFVFNSLFINASTFPDFNKSSNISLFGLAWTTTPQLLKDGVRCDNDSNLCNITSYDYLSGTLEAQIASFSNYTTSGQTCLNVTDDTFVVKNATLCSGTYQVNDTAEDGVIIINTSSIVLNCNNAIITGNTSGVGINSSSRNNNVLFNCNMRNYSSGILLDNSNNNTLRNSRFFYNTYGLFAENSDNNTINLSEFRNSTLTGIFINSSEGNLVERNNISNNSYSGMELSNSIVVDNFNLILNNTISNNTIGILFNNDSGFNPAGYNRIFQNSIGVYFNASSSNLIAINSVNGSDIGILVNDSSNITVENNTLSSNTAGISIQNSAVLVQGNVISNSTENGIIFSSTGNSTIRNNTLLGNNLGINISSSSEINISNTTINSNTRGIFIQDSAAINLNSSNISSNQIGLQLLNSNITASGITSRDNSEYSFFSENSTALISRLFVSPLIFIDNLSSINITPLLIASENATINYSSILIDNTTNTTDNLFLEFNLAGLKSENISELNKTADITFYNLLYGVSPFVLKDGVRCDNDSSLCSIKSYDNTTGTLIFNVTSFTNYTTTTSNVPGTPDNQSPTQPTVVDGFNYADFDWTNSNSTLNGSWFGSTDRSKIFYSYRIMVNSTSCLNGSCSLKDVGEDTQVSVVNITLSECTNYSFDVQAEDTFYNVANLSSSDGIVVDLNPPIITFLNSTTHPDETQNSTANDAEFNWSASDPGNCPSGIYGYSYILDNSNDTAADEIPELFNDTNVTISNIPNGVWYFHLRARDAAGSWSNTSTFRVNIQAEGVSVSINSTATPTFAQNITVFGSISPANATYLLKIYVNNTQVANKTISDTISFNFTGVPLNLGINRIFVNALVNDELEATSNSIYVERINASRVNITSFTIQFSGGTASSRITYSSSSSATSGIGTQSDAASVTGSQITAPVSDRSFIFVTRPGIDATGRNTLLQNKTFFDQVNPSLGYPLDIEQTIISTILNYQDLFIEGNQSVQTGRYNIIITNNGTREGKPQIIVRIT